MIKAIIVDDEKIVREGLKEHYHWAKYGIIVVNSFENGKLAYDFLSQNEIDLVISDVVMPEMNGLELASKARKINPNIKFIFVSGYTDAKYLLEALKLNATDFIFKSIDFDELDAAIERVVEFKQQQSRIKRLEKQVDRNISILAKQQLEEKTSTRVLGAIIDGDSDKISEATKAAFEICSGMPYDDRNNFLYHVLLLPTQILQDVPAESRGSYKSVEVLLGNFMKYKEMDSQFEFILSSLMEASDKYSVTKKPESNAVISTIVSIINDHFMDPISVTSLADNVKLSPAYLCVLFKQVTGMTINQFITQTRLQKAKDMLKDVTYTVEEVCYYVGYLSTSYFSRLFKQTTGLTPSEYRNSVCESQNKN